MKTHLAISAICLVVSSAAAAPAHHHAAHPERLRGISQARRRQIYFEISLAENRAQRQANAAYPTVATNPYPTAAQEDHIQNNIEPNTKMFLRLADQYHAVLCRHYHITEDQITALVVEGFDKHWTSPPQPKD